MLMNSSNYVVTLLPCRATRLAIHNAGAMIRAAMLTAFLLVFATCATITVTAQDAGCNAVPTPNNGMVTGVGKTGVFPNIQASPGGKCTRTVYA